MGVALSPAAVALAAAVVGGLLGALLPVAVYRMSVPFGETLRATCGHCGHRLPWTSVRCPGCGRRLGPQWWVTGLVAALGAGVLARSLPDGPAPLVVAASVTLAVLGTGLGAVDVACHRLPSAIVLPSIVVGALALAAVSASTGDWRALGRAGLGGLVLGVVHLVLYLLPGANLGFGDVQLAALLGLLLGYLGWPEVLWGALLPWLVNAPVVLGLLALGRVGRRSRVPFGPSMLVGAVLSVALVAALGA